MAALVECPLQRAPDEAGDEQRSSARAARQRPKRRRENPLSFLFAKGGAKDPTWAPASERWQQPFVWTATRGRSDAFCRGGERFELEVEPRGAAGAVFLRYLGRGDRVPVKFRLSILSDERGGPAEAWRSDVVVFGRRAAPGVRTSWGSAGFAGGGRTAVTVRCDLLFTTAVTESPLSTLRKTPTPRRPLRSLLEA